MNNAKGYPTLYPVFICLSFDVQLATLHAKLSTSDILAYDDAEIQAKEWSQALCENVVTHPKGGKVSLIQMLQLREIELVTGVSLPRFSINSIAGQYINAEEVKFC